MIFDTRAAWGAKPPPQNSQMRWTSGRPIGVAIHYVGGTGTIGLAAKDHSACFQTMRNLQAYAMRGGNGWTYSDLEYNLAACPHGHVIEGRGIDWQGAAQKGANATHASIVALANVGDVIDGTPLARAVNDAVAAIQAYHPTATQVVGHRDTAGNPTGTNCPGDPIEAWIHAGRPAPGAPAPKPAPAPIPVPQEDIMFATYKGQLHGFYVSRDLHLWQRNETGLEKENIPAEKNVSAVVGFGPIDPTRPLAIGESPNGDLIVGVYGTDGIYNEARWDLSAAHWVKHTFR